MHFGIPGEQGADGTVQADTQRDRRAGRNNTNLRTILRIPGEQRTQQLGQRQQAGEQRRGGQSAGNTHTLSEEPFDATDFLGAQLAGTTFNGGDIDRFHGATPFPHVAVQHCMASHFNCTSTEQQSI